MDGFFTVLASNLYRSTINPSNTFKKYSGKLFISNVTFFFPIEDYLNILYNHSNFYFMGESIFFSLVLCLLLFSLSWRLKCSNRVLNLTVTVYILFLLVILFLSIYFTPTAYIGAKLLFNHSLLINYFTSNIRLFVIFFTAIFLVISLKYFFSENNKENDFTEYSLLIAFSVFFLLILVSSFDLMVMYMAIEGLSIILYILAMFPFNESSIEASIKYYTLGALSSGILLFGISLMFGICGSFDFINIKFFYFFCPNNYLVNYIMFLCLAFGFLFKIAAFPCHMWSPDVYEGTWLPTTIFFMTVVKMALYFFFVRFVIYFFYDIFYIYQDILMASAIGSAIVGCFGSLYQQGIKRLLAYTSISQVGFSFLGLICASLEGISASLLFFIVYIVVSVGIFAILINVESYYKGGSLVYLSDLTNFSKYNISVALIFTIFLFSMAGIPPLGGFVSKLVIFASATGSYFYTFTIGLITISTINVYVYVRMVKAMWSDILLISNEKELLSYDIFIMSLPTNWEANKGESFLFSCYQKLISFILLSIAFFVISFLLFFPEYTLWCNELAISIINSVFIDFCI